MNWWLLASLLVLLTLIAYVVYLSYRVWKALKKAEENLTELEESIGSLLRDAERLEETIKLEEPKEGEEG